MSMVGQGMETGSETVRASGRGERLPGAVHRRTNRFPGSFPRLAVAGLLWLSALTAASAQVTGGCEVKEYTDDDGRWVAHIFRETGDLVVDSPIEVEYLIVAGGGAGGSSGRASTGVGGGGAGGLLQGTIMLPADSHSVTVGEGGEPSTSRSSPGGNGENSSAFGLTAIGGGGGGSSTDWPAGSGGSNGQDGGSGGGAARVGSSAGSIGKALEDVTQGNDGALATSDAVAGGGGGAGSAASGAAGGAGVTTSIKGSSLTFAQGGKGGETADGNGPGEDASGNTGDGGGGAYSTSTTSDNPRLGGAGGSGIVVVRYRLPPSGTSIGIR